MAMQGTSSVPAIVNTTTHGSRHPHRDLDGDYVPRCSCLYLLGVDAGFYHS